MKKPSHKINALRTASAILRDVNAALKRSAHAPYKSVRTLSLVIGEIIHEREAAAADIPN